MLDKFKAFLAKYNITTHSLVAASILLVACYNEVPEVHQLVQSIYGALPHHVQTLILALIAAIAWYWNSRARWTSVERAAKLGTPKS